MWKQAKLVVGNITISACDSFPSINYIQDSLSLFIQYEYSFNSFGFVPDSIMIWNKSKRIKFAGSKDLFGTRCAFGSYWVSHRKSGLLVVFYSRSCWPSKESHRTHIATSESHDKFAGTVRLKMWLDVLGCEPRIDSQCRVLWMRHMLADWVNKRELPLSPIKL